jgi:hypothetical protein
VSSPTVVTRQAPESLDGSAGVPETVAVLVAAGFRLRGHLFERDGEPWALTRS